MMDKRLLLSGCVVCLLAGAETEPRWRALHKASRQAAQANDYAKLHEILLELQPLMPGNPVVTYNLAASEAKLGHPEAALKHLRDLAGTGLVYDIAADEDFSSLKKLSEFAAVIAAMHESKQPVSRSTLAFPIAERDLIPEDIAYEPKTRRFFVSSVRKSKIITGDGKDFAKADWSVLALAVDTQHQLLWATTGWVPHCERCSKANEGKTALSRWI